MPRHALALCLLPLVLAQVVPTQTQTEPGLVAPPTEQYHKLTNRLAAATNFNIETVRGFVLTELGLYVINTHASTIVRHADFVTPRWENEWPTVANPVAITLWNDRLLVVGGASWSLAEHDRTTGRILRHVALPAEPADIAVDHDTAEAYIACQGSNEVVRIDLQTFTENNRYTIPSQRPRFLFLDEGPDGKFVYVAPFLSGNNTTLMPRAFDPTLTEDEVTTRVVDLDRTATPGGDLPDEDLYRIDPNQPPGTPVTPVLHNAGTLITEHARNPATLEYWLISTESGNGDLNAQGKPKKGEHEHRGVFAKAQLAIANNLGSGPRPVPGNVIDLDVPVGGGAKSPATSVAFPFALAFHPSGLAFIAASSSDLITVTGANGVRLFDIPITGATHPSQPPMPPQIGRAIPRDLLFHSPSSTLLVYCWGWNKVFVYDVNNITAAPFYVDIGPDPLPIAAQKGRSFHYDANRPVAAGMPGAVSCNTCHPAGAMDLLGWQLSDSTKDRKDLMVTQSLLSIADLFPFHWRGERNLDHFNGAFVGLLGHAQTLSETPGGELDQFEAFVFSLQAPANPRQHIDRVLDGLSARHGQDVFLNKPNVLGPFSCAGCHALPGGTNGSNVSEVFAGIASTSTLDVAHLRQLTHKDQGPFTVVVPDFAGNNVTVQRARNGFGLAHDGPNFDVPDFIKPVVLGGPFGITPQEQVQISDFVRQFDQGIAPAAHRAYLMNSNDASQVAGVVTSVLLVQAAPAKRWVDVAAFGFETVGGVVVDLRWAYDPATGLFRCHDNSQPQRNLATFVQQVIAGGRYLFVGLPPGNAVRFALDPDNDFLTDAQEVTPGTDPRRRDTDGDSYDDGYEVQVGGFPLTPDVPADGTPPNLRNNGFVRDHEGATFAKFFAEFDEPVTWRLDAVDAVSGNTVSVTREASLQREATIHMHELYSSTPFGGDTRSWTPVLTFTDPRGNPSTFTGNTFNTALMLVPPPFLPVLIDDLTLLTATRNAGTLSVTARVRVRSKLEQNGPLFVPGKVVLAHVLRRPPGQVAWDISQNTATQFVLSGPLVVPAIRLSGDGGVTSVPYNALQGDFLLSTPTDNQGNATFTFSRHLLQTGDEVRIAVLAVVAPVPGSVPTFDVVSLFEWDLPTTQGGATPTVPQARDLRGLTTTY